MSSLNVLNMLDLFLKQEIKNLLEARIKSEIGSVVLSKEIDELFEDDYSKLLCTIHNDCKYFLEVYMEMNKSRNLIERWTFVIKNQDTMKTTDIIKKKLSSTRKLLIMMNRILPTFTQFKNSTT